MAFRARSVNDHQRRERQRGRKENRNSDRGRQRRDRKKGRGYTDMKTPKGPYGFEDFKLVRIGKQKDKHEEKRQGGGNVNLSKHLESLNWDDGEDGITGSAIIRDFKGLRLREGDTLKLGIAASANKKHHREMWRCRVSTVRDDQGEGQLTVDFSDDSDETLDGGEEDFKFNGVRADKALKKVAKKFNIKLGAIPKSKTKLKKLTMKGVSARQALDQIIGEIKDDTGKGYRLDMRGKDLKVMPEKRPKGVAYELEKLLMGVIVTRSLAEQASTTEVFDEQDVEDSVDKDGNKKGGKKGDRKGGTKRKAKGKATSAAKAERHGGKKKRKKSKGEGASKAKKRAKRDAKENSRPTREVEVTHPGVPSLERDMAIKVFHKGKGERGVVYVRSVSFSLTPGEFNMTVTATFERPEDRERDDQEAKQRGGKAKERGRKSKDDHGGRKHKATERSSQRRDKHDLRSRSKR